MNLRNAVHSVRRILYKPKASHTKETLNNDSRNRINNINEVVRTGELTLPKFDGHRFANPSWPTHRHDNFSFRRMYRWWKTPPADSPPRCPKALHAVLPILEPNLQEEPNVLKVTWLGHSTGLVQLGDRCVLTDPVFSNRASPLKWIGLGPTRYRPPPLPISGLPRIDVVVISHNHYDHLDSQTVQALRRNQYERFSVRPTFIVPLGLRSWFLRRGFQRDEVIELNWHECHFFKDRGINVQCLPAQHWSRRGFFDKNKSLWASFAVNLGSKKFFFAGDTAYCPEFENIGRLYGPFDLAAIPIGCYEPRWFMQNQHVGPDEAVLIHCEIRSAFSIAIHYGTYSMGSREGFLEPRLKLREILADAQITNFYAPEHGETLRVP